MALRTTPAVKPTINNATEMTNQPNSPITIIAKPLKFSGLSDACIIFMNAGAIDHKTELRRTAAKLVFDLRDHQETAKNVVTQYPQINITEKSRLISFIANSVH